MSLEEDHKGQNKNITCGNGTCTDEICDTLL